MHPFRGDVGCSLWRRFSLTLGHASALKPHWGFIHYRSAASLPGTNRASPGRCGSTISKNRTTRFGVVLFLEAPPGIEPGMRVLQTRALPLGYGAIWSGKRGSNPPPIAWKAIALPNELLPPVEVWLSWGRVDSNHRTLPRTDLQSVAIAAMRLPRFPTNSFGSVGVRADEGTRTPDRLITNQLLYQLSYIGFVQTCQTTRFSLFEAAKILHFSNTAKVFFIFFALYILIH